MGPAYENLSRTEKGRSAAKSPSQNLDLPGLDFSAYSDLAIGCARLFGFRVPENFRYPVGSPGTELEFAL